MKKLLGVLFCGAVLAVSCSDDDEVVNPVPGGDSAKDVPQQVQAAFKKQYPSVKDVKWEKVQAYHVARFNGKINRAATTYTSSAWFTADGDYRQGDEDIAFNAMPEVVRAGFNAYKESLYPDWTVDECEIVMRKGMGIVYVVEIEKGVQERDIHLSEFGDILMDVLDDDTDDADDEVLPVEIPAEAMAALEKWCGDSVQNLQVLEYEVENGEIEFDILVGNCHKEVKFNSSTYAWVSTEWEATFDEVVKLLPAQVVENLLAKAKAAGVDLSNPEVLRNIEIEVTDHVTEGLSLEIEIDFGGKEFEIRVDAKGNVIIEIDD